MKSPNTLYRIYLPTKDKVSACRKDDFKVIKEDTQLPSFLTLTSDISIQRQLEEFQKIGEEKSTEEVLKISYFTHYSQVSQN